MMLFEECSCGNDDSSMKQGFRSLRNYSVPKKLLVAMSVMVVVSFYVRTTEAASLEHRRHRPHRHMAKYGASEASKTEARLHETEISTKEHKISRLLTNDQYVTALQKIKHKMANTKDNYDERRKMVNLSKTYGDGMPEWLPKTNFRNIHYKSIKIANKMDASRSKRFFFHNIRQLYKSLVIYHELFKIFKNITVRLPDVQVISYVIRRHEFFTKSINDQYSTIEDIKDAMIKVKMPIPKVESPKRLKLDTIDMHDVDEAKFLKNDEILFRGYGNLLNKWNLELNCSKVTKPIRKEKIEKCIQYRNSLKDSRNERKVSRRRKQL